MEETDGADVAMRNYVASRDIVPLKESKCWRDKLQPTSLAGRDEVDFANSDRKMPVSVPLCIQYRIAICQSDRRVEKAIFERSNEKKVLAV